jgi:ketosteroid isomerase-like protein
MERAASQLRDGEFDGFDRIVEFASGDLGFIVEIERARVKVGGRTDLSPVHLRVTTIFRREDGEWRILHRHADPIVTPRPIESLLER